MKIELPPEIIKDAKEFGMAADALALRILENWCRKKHREVVVCRRRPLKQK